MAEDKRAAELLARLEFLKQEIERKTEFISSHSERLRAEKAKKQASLNENEQSESRQQQQQQQETLSQTKPPGNTEKETLKVETKVSSNHKNDDDNKSESAELKVEKIKADGDSIQSDIDEILNVFQELLALAKDASTEALAAKMGASGISEGEEYESFRNLIIQLSLQLEQEARKVVLGWVRSKNDKEARQDLLRCLVKPAEGLVVALSTVSSSHKMINLLRVAASARATEICNVCIALLEGLETKQLPPLAGAVEAVCENIRKLPVSNAAAFKRFALEQAKTLSDTQAEFEEIAESGMVDWGLPEDDEDDIGEEEEEEEEEEDEVDEEDKKRILLFTKAIARLKSIFLLAGNVQKLSTEEYNSLNDILARCMTAATDFGVELYPPHDTPRVIQKATILKHEVSPLAEILASEPDFAKALDEFHVHLNLFVV